MAVTLRNSFPTASIGAGGGSVNKPTGTQAGDLLLLEVVTSEDVVPSPPEGFVLVPGAEITGLNTLRIYQKIATSAEPDSYFVYTHSSGGNAGLVAIAPNSLAYAAVHQVATASSDSASSSKVWNGVTNTDPNTVLLCFGSFGSNAASTPDAAMTERWDAGSTRHYLMTQAVAATGATGTRTATGSSVARQRCITISVTETATKPFELPDEVHVTSLPVLVEVQGEAVYLTSAPVLVELGAVGVYLSSYPILVEVEYQEPPPTMPTYYPKAAGNRATHYALPEEVTGYALDPEHSWWSSVVPEQGRNLLANPSFELDFDVADVFEYAGFSAGFFNEFNAIGATAGKRSLRLTVADSPDNTLDYIGDLTLTAGAYTWSLDVYFNRPPGTIRLQVLDADTDDVVKQSTFTSHVSGWRRIHLTWVEMGTGARKLRLNSRAGVNPAGSHIYTDAWQLEAKKYPTTYFDGDMVGFNDLQPNQSFFWEGAPHQSPSVRRAHTGAGGRLVSWSDDIGFYTMGVAGLGMGPVTIHTKELTDGSELHEAVLSTPRDFTITGRIYADNYSMLQERVRDLVRLIRPNNTRHGQQSVLRYQQTDSRGNFVGAPLDIVCVYKDGMGGNVNNLYQQTFPIQFHASQPFPVETIDSAAELQTERLLYNNGVIFKDENGGYVNLGTGDSDAFVRRVDFDAQGRPVAASPFGKIAGSTADDVAYWDGDSWVQLGATPVGNTYSIDGGWRYGYPVVVGSNDGVYEYDEELDAWDEIGNGLDGAVRVVVRDVDGSVYAGGDFTDNGSASNASLRHVAVHYAGDGVYSSLGPGVDHTLLNATVHALLIHDGWLYVGGLFNTIDDGVGPALPAHNVARWDIARQRWDTMSSGFNDEVRGLAVAEDGFIYAVGDFSMDGGGSFDLRGIARWNGAAWEEPFELVDVDGNYGADGMAVDEHGVMWFYKELSSADDYFDVSDTIGPSETFGWKNGVFYPSFVRNSGGLWYMSIGPGNRTIMSVLNVAEDATPEVAVPALNEIDYPGDANAPMVLHLHGAMSPSFVLSLDMGGGVYFLPDLAVGAQEEMVIRTDMQRSLMYSEGRPNLYRYMSAGPSSSKLLQLVPGVNRISIFAQNGEGASAWLGWRNRYWGIEAASSL